MVSAIIPTRDRPRLLERAVRSALEQTGAAVDVVVVDDGSDPPVTLSSLEDPRVRIVRLERPQGPAAARNAGVAHSRGEFIAFLDDDDEWRPHKTARQLARAQVGGPLLAGVACGYDLWAGSSIIGRVRPPAGDLPRALLANPCLAPSTVLLRRAALEAVGGFDPSQRRCEDWDLWVRLADRYRIETLMEVLVDRRAQPLAPGEALVAVSEMLRRLGPRIEALPPEEARRVRAHHDLVVAVLHHRLGQSRDTRAGLWSSWRQRPRSPRPLFHMLRILIGSSVWDGVAMRARRLRYRRASLAAARDGPPGPSTSVAD